MSWTSEEEVNFIRWGQREHVLGQEAHAQEWRWESTRLLQTKELRAGFSQTPSITPGVWVSRGTSTCRENGQKACELLEPEATSASAGPVAREQKRSDAQKLPDEGERKPHGKERRVKGKMGTYLASGQVDLRCWAYVTGTKSYWESNRLDAPCSGSSVWSEA